MKRWMLGIGVLGLLFSGCHTIRPVATADTSYLEKTPHSSKKILLVLDEDYRSYVSHDRGNSMADPQAYHVGEALGPLTTAFFTKAYPHADIAEKLPAAAHYGEWDFVICPRVESFSNDLGSWSLKQSIAVGLSADIFDSQLNDYGRVSGAGWSNGGLGASAVIWGSTKNSSMIVSLALQEALQALVSGVVKKTG